MREWGSDPEAPWWVKLRRARVHIDEVQRCADALGRSEAWSIQREPADCAEGWLFWFKIVQGIPADLSAVVGDSVANMRSALDYVAYELALRHVGEELSEEQEAATAFPICIDDEAFQRFFTNGQRGRLRGGLYGQWPCLKGYRGIVTVSWHMMVLRGCLRTAGCRTGSRSGCWPGFSRRSWWMRRWPMPGRGSSGAGCCRRG